MGDVYNDDENNSSYNNNHAERTPPRIFNQVIRYPLDLQDSFSNMLRNRRIPSRNSRRF